jgi:putative tricarboxylic transport membrane protein
MRRYGFSPAALVIALVLGPLAEETLRQTLLISGGSFDIFVQRGASQLLLAFIAVLFVLTFIGPVIARRLRDKLEARAERRRAESVPTGGSSGEPSEDRPEDDQRQVDV